MIDSLCQLDNGYWMAVYIARDGSRHLRTSFHTPDEALDWANGLTQIDDQLALVTA